MIDHRLTILNLYELKGAPEDFEIAVGALATRVEAEGHPGVLSYRFFVNASERTARGVIDYKDADAWIGHHDIAMSWPEMTALHAAASAGMTRVVQLLADRGADLNAKNKNGQTPLALTLPRGRQGGRQPAESAPNPAEALLRKLGATQ